MPDYKKGQVWNKSKNKLMLEFEKSTGKNAVYNNKITGNFEYWLWQKEKKKAKQIPIKKSTPKKKSYLGTRSIEEILGEVEPIVASQYWRRLDKGERKIILEIVNYKGKFEYVLNKEYSQLSDNLKNKLRIDDNFKKYTIAIDKYRLKKKKVVKTYQKEESTIERERLYYKISGLITKNNENIYKWHQTALELNSNRELLLYTALDKSSDIKVRKKIKELREDLESWADKRDKTNIKITVLAKKGNFELKYAKDPYGGAKAYHIKGIKPTFYFEPTKSSNKFDYTRLTTNKIQKWSPEIMTGVIPKTMAIKLVKSKKYYIISSQAIGFVKKN